MSEIELSEKEKESRNIGVLIWIGSIFLGFIPALIIYLVKKDDARVQDQSKEALNWFITIVVGYFVSAVLMLIVIGVILFLALAITNLVVCIMGAVANSNGKEYRAPFAIRLIK